MALIKSSPGQQWPGFSFALHLLRVQGFYFCPAAAQPHTSVYSGFYFINESYTTHSAKQRTGLYRRFSSDLPHSADVYTRPTQTAIIPPAQCWSISQYCSTSSAYQRPAPRRTLYSSAQTAYYNNVYKGAGVRHRYGSTPDGAAHRRPSKPGGAVQ